MAVWRVVWAVWMVVLLWQMRAGRGQDSCSQCDCKLSSNEEERAIFNLKSSRCTAGTVDWGIAYGAIRLEVQPFQPHDYRLCFLVLSHNTLTQVSLEAPEQHHPPPQHHQQKVKTKTNYRLHSSESVKSSPQQGGGGMRRLLTTDGQSGEVCVLGRARQALMLFVEVQRSNQRTGIPSVRLQYDVEPLPGVDAVLADPMEECRPCTQEELLEAYCTSDFVAVGRILQARQPEDDQQGLTHMEVAVAQLIHQNSPIFRRHRRQDRHLQGVIHAPARCGIRPGKGGYLLFTGRMRLGKAKLRCAPFLDEWVRVSHLAECVY